MQNLNITLKSLIRNIPQFSIFIIILGLSKQMLYFNNFNLPIQNYLSLSEIGLLIANDLFLVGFSFLLIFLEIFIFSIKENSSNTTKQNKKINPIKYSYLNKTLGVVGRNKMIRILERIIKWVIYIIGALIFLFMIIGPIAGFFWGKTYSNRMYYAIFAIALLIITVTFLKINIVIKHFGEMAIPNILFGILFLISFFFSTPYSIKKVENGYYSGTIIKTSNHTYVSDRDNFYIGQTSQFIFIYSRCDSTTTIIPIGKVDKIVLKKDDSIKVDF